MRRIDKIIAQEPRVNALLDEARHSTEDWDLAYPVYKDRLMKLVGWCAERDELRSEQDYNAALDALCEALER